MFSVENRKSSCVNARGIPTAAYQVLHLLTEVGYPPIQVWPGGEYPRWGYPHWGTPCWGTPCLGLTGVPPIQVLWGVPEVGYPPLLGYPPWTWLGYPPGVDRQTDEWMDGWMDGQTDGWMDGWMDGWTDTCQNITFPSYYVRGR